MQFKDYFRANDSEHELRFEAGKRERMSANSEKKSILKQVNPPLEMINDGFLPWMLLSEGKIVKYDISAMKVWRALIQTTHTIISNSNVYNLLWILTFVCFLTWGIVYITNGAKSIDDSLSVFTRTQSLLSFVLAGYVTLCIQRWDKIRNEYVGNIWGGCESLVLISCDLIPGNSPIESNLADKLIRYNRLVMRLLFYAARGINDLTPLIEKNTSFTKEETELLSPLLNEEGDIINIQDFSCILTEEEMHWLNATHIGTRPLLVLMWIKEIFNQMLTFNDESGKKCSNRLVQHNIYEAINKVRGGVGSTLGILGCPYPFMYVHAISWIVQMSLVILAVETGCTIAILYERRNEGSGEYHNKMGPGMSSTWPLSPDWWFVNAFLQLTFQNIVFAIFTEGLLLIGAKLANPLADNAHCFPDMAYDAYLYNNCRAIRAGFGIGKSFSTQPPGRSSSDNTNSNSSEFQFDTKIE